MDAVLTPELMLRAYTMGIFPMSEGRDDPEVLWVDPKRRGILPALYLDNVARYIREGGAVLVAAGPDFASADSLYRSPLGQVMPAQPSARVLEDAYRPEVSEIGERHPVTTGLPSAGDWGRWLRQIDVEPRSGQTVMEGIDDRPLLILDRVEEGRVALLASDHAWLWNRGYEGGGPQLELLRRLAHWMMKEPELEEEALTAVATGQNMRIARRTLEETVPPVTVTGPDGSVVTLDMVQTAPGLFETDFEGPEIGLYRLANGDQETVIGVGPALPAGELDAARELATQIGIRLVEQPTAEIANADYQANAPDRCYHCKTELYTHVERVAKSRGRAVIANGANADDA